jgi:hypothetical protein
MICDTASKFFAAFVNFLILKMIVEKHSEYTLLSLITFFNFHPSLDTGKNAP